MSLTNTPTLKGQCIAEFASAFILIFFGAGSVAALVLTGASYGQWEISIVWGMAVAIAIYVAGGVSGAHFNPAVTIALAAFCGFDKKKVLPYIGSQILGTFTAAAVVYTLYANLFIDWELANGVARNSEAALATAGIFSTYPNPSLSFTGAFLVEVVITAMLMFCILAFGDENNGPAKGAMTPLLIGLLVATIGGSIGPLTGFAMNPARDFGPKLFAYLAGWDFALTGAKDIPYFIVPIFAPILGASFAAWLYPKAIGNHLVSEQIEVTEIEEAKQPVPATSN